MTTGAMDYAAILKQLSIVIISESEKFSTVFILNGQEFLAILLFAVIVFNALEIALGGGMDAFVELIVTVIQACVVLSLIMNYQSAVIDSITSIFNGLQLAATGGQSGDAAMESIVNLLTSTSGKLYVQLLDNTKNSLLSWKSVIPGVAAAHMQEGLVGLLFITIASVLLMLSAIVVMWYWTLGTFLLGISLAFGPLMIPSIIHERVSFIFDGWFKYTIGAGFLKLVAIVVITITANVLISMQAHLEINITNGDALPIQASMTAVLLALTVLFLCLQIPDIASGLLSGATKGAKGSLPGAGLAKNVLKSVKL